MYCQQSDITSPHPALPAALPAARLVSGEDRWPMPAYVVLLAMLLLCMTVRAGAQSTIMISGNNNLDFGMLPRSNASAVDYGSSGAAHFIITGDTASSVRLTVSISDLSTGNGASTSSADRLFIPLIASSDCAFSLDGGNIWQTFSTGMLYHDTVFPSAASATSSIHVRIGARLASGARQQRGNYTGTVTLTAEYR